MAQNFLSLLGCAHQMKEKMKEGKLYLKEISNPPVTDSRTRNRTTFFFQTTTRKKSQKF